MLAVPFVRPRALVPALAAVLAACSDTATPVAAPSAAREIPVAELKQAPSLLSCQQQPYAITSQTVGLLGGTVRVGNHRLEIPAGALLAPVLITAEAPADNAASVRFFPEGLRFVLPAYLTLDYSHCPSAATKPGKSAVFTTDGLSILSLLGSTDDTTQTRVTTLIDHFSRYAVAW